MQRIDRAMETDVLVVGGGAAGLTAALEARARGASVVVAAKGRAGRSGNSMVAVGGLAGVLPRAEGDDSPERHFQDSLSAGQGINDEKLLRLLVSQAGPRILKLEEWGVALLRSQGELVRRRAPGHSRRRGLATDSANLSAHLGGLALTAPLRATAERMGVRFLDQTPVLRLLSHEGEVRGAVAVDLESGALLQIEANSVVVAAGGGGRLYANTNNTRDVCGDSYGLMLEAGAVLRDMEFVQVFPCQMRSPIRAIVPSYIFEDGGTLRNRRGEPFMARYDPVNRDMATRDVMGRAIFYEIQGGNGIEGAVYLDCTAIPEPVLQTKYAAQSRVLARHGIDMARDWLRVGPAIHFFMGGAEIDEECRTGVPGLFAAGEAAGGVHGANRIGGNALTEAVVFGALAGRAAAEHVGGRGRVGRFATPVSSESAGGQESLDDQRRELRKAMWEGASIVRSEASLQATLSTLRRCAEATASAASSRADLPRREETRLMVLAAEAVVLSALARRESRGVHFREDFPLTDDRGLGSHRVRLVGETLKVEFRPKGE